MPSPPSALCLLSPQHGGALWPSETSKVRASRWQQDARLGNVSLIPLRGTESEMRSSVAAFATDPLTVSDGGMPAPGGPAALGPHRPCITCRRGPAPQT